MYVAVLERAMDSLTEKARASTEKARSAPQKIEKLKDALMSFVRHKKNFFRLYFITRFEVLPYLDRTLAKRLESTTKGLDSLFHDIYEQGVKKGELSPGDPLTMGDIFFAQVIGLMLLKNAEILDPPLASIVNKATRFFIRNIMAGKRNPAERKN